MPFGMTCVSYLVLLAEAYAQNTDNHIFPTSIQADAVLLNLSVSFCHPLKAPEESS